MNNCNMEVEKKSRNVQQYKHVRDARVFPHIAIFFTPKRIGKSLIDPPNYKGWSTLPSELWNGLIYPLNFAKPAKSLPRAVLGGGFATVNI
jgi:hypothetical protein